MSLAQRLNELAVANSQGLLNDDEYRLLRQNAFEQYSAEPVLLQSHPSDPRSHDPLPQLRSKPTVASGVANLFRKATTRKTPTPVNDLITTKHKDGRKTSNSTNETHSKRSAKLPRLLQKKAVELPPLRTDVSSPREDAFRSSSNATPKDAGHPSQLSIPGPSGSNEHYVSPMSPLLPERSISTMRDIFDEDNLYTAKDIGDAIATTEDEARRLIDAFDDLEATTVRRIQKQNARRLPIKTPANINVLLEGREWREHRLISSPSSPLFDSRQRYFLTSAESNSDEMSVRSGSSYKTTLSQSKSISSLPKLAPSSPLSAQFRTSSRKNSFSSISSQATSVPSSVTLGVDNSPSLARSTSHLALRKTNEISGKAIIESSDHGISSYENPDQDSELLNIRKRREDLTTRYTARLEFLRAKLKGAELHEKLLRK